MKKGVDVVVFDVNKEIGTRVWKRAHEVVKEKGYRLEMALVYLASVQTNPEYREAARILLEMLCKGELDREAGEVF